MLTFFPRYFSTRAVIGYVVTLALVSCIFIDYALPFQFMLFGFVPVCMFFVYSNKLTMDWRRFSARLFTKKLFQTALIIRIVCVVFLYFYFIEMTGVPFTYGAADEIQYQYSAELIRIEGFKQFWKELNDCYSFSDRGYITWLGFEYFLFGTHVLSARLLKCVIDAFSCVLIYNLAKRNFGEPVGRMAGIFYMLMPNMWYYCGITLKEIEMVFLTILFAERADLVLHSPRIKVAGVLLPGLCILVMFTFRTALAAVMFATFAAGLIIASSKQIQSWQKVLYGLIFGAWMFATVGVEMIQETQDLWANKESNQAVGYEWRSKRAGGNTFAQYASATVFAPLIFTIPFSSMVATPGQENVMMMNGANFIKNILSGIVICALISLLFSGEWRKHVIPFALTCGYLVVIVFSNFAHSERFHLPVLGFELVFAAYGISLVKNMHKRWFMVWLVLMCTANILWAWIKLAGRGLL